MFEPIKMFDVRSKRAGDEKINRMLLSRTFKMAARHPEISKSENILLLTKTFCMARKQLLNYIIGSPRSHNYSVWVPYYHLIL